MNDERLRAAVEDVASWLEVEADHPRPDPRPAMRLQAGLVRAALAATPPAPAPPPGTRLVLMSDELMKELGATRVEWGTPDENGWYTPTLYSDETERGR